MAKDPMVREPKNTEPELPKIFNDVFEKCPDHLHFELDGEYYFIKNYGVLVTTIGKFKELQPYLDKLLDKHLHDSNKYYHQKRHNNYLERRPVYGKLRNYRTVETNENVIELRCKSQFSPDERQSLAFTSPYIHYIKLQNHRVSRKIEVHVQGVNNVKRLGKALYYCSEGLTIQVEKRMSKKDRIRNFFKMWIEDAKAYLREDKKVTKLETFFEGLGLRHRIKMTKPVESPEARFDESDEEELQNEVDDILYLYQERNTVAQVPNFVEELYDLKKKQKPRLRKRVYLERPSNDGYIEFSKPFPQRRDVPLESIFKFTYNPNKIKPVLTTTKKQPCLRYTIPSYKITHSNGTITTTKSKGSKLLHMVLGDNKISNFDSEQQCNKHIAATKEKPVSDQYRDRLEHSQERLRLERDQLAQLELFDIKIRKPMDAQTANFFEFYRTPEPLSSDVEQPYVKNFKLKTIFR